MALSFKIVFAPSLGPHTRVQVFAGEQGQTRANLGTLCMRQEEFAAFTAALMVGARMVSPPSTVEVVAQRVLEVVRG